MFTEPSPTDLIVKFITVAEGEKEAPPPDAALGLPFLPTSYEGYNRRGKCLKILALKVAAFLNFNLDEFENKCVRINARRL